MTNGPNAANAARKRSRKRREFSAGGEKKLRGELPAVSCVSFAVDVAARASSEVVDSFFSCVDAGCKDVKAASVVFFFLLSAASKVGRAPRKCALGCPSAQKLSGGRNEFTDWNPCESEASGKDKGELGAN